MLPTEDADISRVAGRGLAKQNITIHTGTLVENVEDTGDKVTFTYGDESGEVEYLVIAAGRGPDVDALGLEAAGVKLDDRGLIDVDGAMRTSADGVFAIGDLVHGPALAHKASDEGVIAAEAIAGLETHPIEYIDIPRATFCTPNVGSFGLTEAQAREQGLDVVVGKVNYGAVGAGAVYGDRGGMIKIIGDKQYGERADPGAREREGARGRVRRGGADRARPSHAVGGRDGGRAGGRWLAHPRIARPRSRRASTTTSRRRRPTWRRSRSTERWARCRNGCRWPSGRRRSPGSGPSSEEPPALTRARSAFGASSRPGLNPFR